MKRRVPLDFLVAGAMFVALASCNNTQQNFRKMSEEELLAYNASVPILDQVYCREEVQIGSHIRQRVCVKIRDVLDGTITSLNTASSSSSVPYHRR